MVRVRWDRRLVGRLASSGFRAAPRSRSVSSTWCAAFVLLAVLLAAPARAQGVHVVAGDGGGDFFQLQDAVTAAANGDVILVRPHSERYDFTVVDGKSLTIVGEGDARPQVEDLTIRDLNAGRDVSVRFLDLEGRSEPEPFFGALQRPGVTLEDDAGCVWLEDLVVAGGDGIVKLGGFEDAHPGLRVVDSNCVIAVDCTFEGGEGKWSVGGSSYSGGDGADLANGRVALHGGTVQGGAGGLGVISFPGQGGVGLDASASAVFASGSSCTGGDTGDEALFPTPDPSASGLVARDGSSVHHLATAFTPGGGDAAPGAPITVEGGSSVEDLLDVHRALKVPAAVREGEEAHVVYSGAPGDVVWMRFASGSAWELLAGLKGVQHLGGATVEVVLGSADAAGTLDVAFRAPELPVGVAGMTGHVQAVVKLGGGGLRLAAPTTATILDATIPLP